MSANVVQIGIDHRTVPLDTLERLHVARKRGRSSGALCDACRGSVALATCHRVELYLEDTSPEAARGAFASWLGGGDGGTADLVAAAPVRSGPPAAEHLLRVAAGLESAVLGEDQILAQVRGAYRDAVATGSPGPLLHRLFHAAFRTGRRVRSETVLAQGARSLPAAALGLLARRLRGLAGRRFLVVGAGEMGSLAAARLRDRGAAEITISSRTTHHAEELAARVGARVLPWSWRASLLAEVDGVACATGASEAVLTADDLHLAMKKRTGPLVVVDLGVPRNVEVPDEPVPGLDVIDMATIALHLRADAAARVAAVAKAEQLVAEELEAWWSWACTRSPRAADVHRARRGSAAG